MCCRFGWEEEDSKGNCGCRYNQKTLDKKYNQLVKEEQEGFSEFCESFCNFVKKEEVQDESRTDL